MVRFEIYRSQATQINSSWAPVSLASLLTVYAHFTIVCADLRQSVSRSASMHSHRPQLYLDVWPTHPQMNFEINFFKESHRTLVILSVSLTELFAIQPRPENEVQGCIFYFCKMTLVSSLHYKSTAGSGSASPTRAPASVNGCTALRLCTATMRQSGWHWHWRIHIWPSSLLVKITSLYALYNLACTKVRHLQPFSGYSRNSHRVRLPLQDKHPSKPTRIWDQSILIHVSWILASQKCLLDTWARTRDNVRHSASRHSHHTSVSPAMLTDASEGGFWD